jgi:hypothetical protein
MKKYVILAVGSLSLLCGSAAFGMDQKTFKKIKDNQWMDENNKIYITKLYDRIYVIKDDISLTLQKDDNVWKKMFSAKFKTEKYTQQYNWQTNDYDSIIDHNEIETSITDDKENFLYQNFKLLLKEQEEEEKQQLSLNDQKEKKS